MLYQTPKSVPTYTTLESTPSTTIVLCGIFTGGLTLVHVGDGDNAFVLLNTWPGCPGVPSSKPESVTYKTFALEGSKAKSVAARLETPLETSMSIQLAPPLVVRRSDPAAVPNA